MDGVIAAGAPLIVTRDAQLLDQLLRLCAAASIDPEVIDDPAQARIRWRQASCVLVGEDLADDVAAMDLTRRDDVLLVAVGRESALTWQRGVLIRADRVVFLPQAEAWLVGRLSDCAEDAPERVVAVGFIGACGGAGASTLAAASGLLAARGARTTLVDADSLAGGVDLLLGCEDVEGLRWPDLAATEGRVNAAELRSALPFVDRLAVLSWHRGGTRVVPARAVATMLSACRRGSEAVVVDLPRRLDDMATQAASQLEILLLVCPADVRAVAGARHVLAGVRSLVADVRLVVRYPAGAGLSADQVAAQLELPLALETSTQRSLARAIGEGLGPLARGRLSRDCSTLLRGLTIPGDRSG